jgi:hypothetical protein
MIIAIRSTAFPSHRPANERLTIVTADRRFAGYDVPVIDAVA